MKNKVSAVYIYSCLAVLSPLFLTGCGDTPVPSPTPEIRFLISNGHPWTRVSYDTATDSVASFDVGDLLGAFALDSIGVGSSGDNIYNTVVDDERGVTCSNLQFRVAGEDVLSYVLEPVVPQDDMPPSSRYVFYYPFREGTAYDNVTHAVETDQSTERFFVRSDLMWDIARHEGGPYVYVAIIEMCHAMSQIVFNIDASMLDGRRSARLLDIPYVATGIDMTIKGVEDMRYEVGTPTSDISMWCCIDSAEGAVQFRALVPAQTVGPGPFLQIDAPDGKRKTYSLPEELEMLPGCNYTFNVVGTATTGVSAASDQESSDGLTTYITLQPA